MVIIDKYSLKSVSTTNMNVCPEPQLYDLKLVRLEKIVIATTVSEAEQLLRYWPSRENYLDCFDRNQAPKYLLHAAAAFLFLFLEVSLRCLFSLKSHKKTSLILIVLWSL